MARAVVNGVVIAESDDVVKLGSYLYFPREAVAAGALCDRGEGAHMPWMGDVTYYDVACAGGTMPHGAFAFDAPQHCTERLTGRVAFWCGVQVEA